MSDETLQYPAKIAEEIGLAKNEINALKRKGCRYYGRKTCITWVREYLDRATNPAKESVSEQPARLQRSADYKSCELAN